MEIVLALEKVTKLNLTCIMTTKQLKKENDSLKAQLEELTKEISVLKATINNAEAANDRSRHDGMNRCSSSARVDVENEEREHGLQFLSHEYDDLSSFRRDAINKINLIEKKLKKLGDRVEELANAVDSAELYSYQYNVKIVGLPQAAEHESSEATAALCLHLFETMGADGININDIDIAHRVPPRRRSNEGASNGNRPDPVICKFTRRLARDKVLSKRQEVRKVKYSDLGLTSDDTVNYLAVYEHLTPRLQDLLFEAKKFQTSHRYQFCWAKGSTILLRQSSDSRVIKLKTMSDLEVLTSRHQR